MSNHITKLIIILLIAVIIIGVIPTDPVHAVNFQIDESYLENETDGNETEKSTVEKVTVSILENKLTQLWKSMLNNFKEMFGLFTIDELIYNRDKGELDLWWLEDEETVTNGNYSTGDVSKYTNEEEAVPRNYYMGIMPDSWHNSARSMHLIFQAIAWSMLGIAIVKNLLQVSLGTINPMMKFRFYDGIRDLFMAGFLLVGSLLIIETMFVFNQSLVEIFTTTIPTGSFANMGDNGTFASVLLQTFYFFIEMYLNFVYIVRAISIAVLIATAPLFIMSITFEGKNVLFMKWFKEITANIFLQSFHAFMLSFLLSVQFSATGFENMVILFSLVPLTEFFRSLILGKDAGGMAHTLGMGAITAGAGAIAGGAAALEGNKRESKGKGGGDNFKKSDTFDGKPPSMKTSGSTIEGNAKAPSNKTSKDALDTLPIAKNGSNTELSGRINKDGATVGNAGKSVAKGALKTAGGAMGVAAGVSMSAITGGKVGGKMIGKGVSSIGSGGKDIGSGASGAFSMAHDKYGPNVSTAGFNKKFNDSNIIAAETMPNGKVAIHRDKQSLQNEGLMDVSYNDESKTHTFTYDTNKMSPGNLQKLSDIKNNYNNHSDLSKQFGVHSVSTGRDGLVRVEANGQYLRGMGIEGMYATENRFVEQKGANQNSYTRIVPRVYDAPDSNNKQASRK